MQRSRLIAFICLMLLFRPGAPAWLMADEVTHQIEKPVRKAIDTRQSTQREAEQWRDEREKLLARYDALEQSIGRLTSRKDALTQSNDQARQRIAAKEQQLAHIEQISAGIAPFIVEIINHLRKEVNAGLPFLREERRARLERLTRLAADPEVAVSEKFRKVMEALMVEAEYGNTIEVYQETAAIDGSEILINVFRLGRMNLFYQTLDHQNCGVYNLSAERWETLPDTYNAAIETAIEIGAKRQPVELLHLPLGRMATR